MGGFFLIENGENGRTCVRVCSTRCFLTAGCCKVATTPKAGPISSSSAEWNGLFQPHRRLICSERKGEGVKLDLGRGCCGVLSNVVVGA